jgi:hypothetical protein
MYYPATGSIQMLVDGEVTPVTRVATGAHRVVADTGYLYWTDTSGAIGRAPAH